MKFSHSHLDGHEINGYKLKYYYFSWKIVGFVYVSIQVTGIPFDK